MFCSLKNHQSTRSEGGIMKHNLSFYLTMCYRLIPFCKKTWTKVVGEFLLRARVVYQKNSIPCKWSQFDYIPANKSSTVFSATNDDSVTPQRYTKAFDEMHIVGYLYIRRFMQHACIITGFAQRCAALTIDEFL